MPFAAYQPPGAFSSDRTGWFYVTEPYGNGASGQAASLRDHCRHEIAATALHEGYPGHHLQFLSAQGHDRLVRRLVSTPVTVEGWALYCEDMMGEEGFYRSPEEHFFQQVALLWRALRVVLDVGLHTQAVSFPQAVEQSGAADAFQSRPCGSRSATLLRGARVSTVVRGGSAGTPVRARGLQGCGGQHVLAAPVSRGGARLRRPARHADAVGHGTPRVKI